LAKLLEGLWLQTHPRKFRKLVLTSRFLPLMQPLGQNICTLSQPKLSDGVISACEAHFYPKILMAHGHSCCAQLFLPGCFVFLFYTFTLVLLTSRSFLCSCILASPDRCCNRRQAAAKVWAFVCLEAQSRRQLRSVDDASSSFLHQETKEGKKINCPHLQILSSDLIPDISWLNFVNLASLIIELGF
jgi:hypothetical protein